MHILITGASGFIGGHLVRCLMQSGHQITGCVRDPRTAASRCPEVRFIRDESIKRAAEIIKIIDENVPQPPADEEIEAEQFNDNDDAEGAIS